MFYLCTFEFIKNCNRYIVMENVVISTVSSLLVQLVIGVFCIYGLSFELDKSQIVLRELLIVETIVQSIEFIFYLFILYVILTSGLANVTSIRYFDWFLTTPMMLISIVVYLVFKTKNSETNEQISMISIVEKYWNDLSFILICNSLMLIFGYLGETNVINIYYASIIGFIFFFAAFYRIYSKFVQGTIFEKEFFLIFGIWSLYGVAALLEPVYKNNMYNTLDIFSKNIMGLFLYYQVRKASSQ